MRNISTDEGAKWQWRVAIQKPPPSYKPFYRFFTSLGAAEQFVAGETRGATCTVACRLVGPWADAR